jgi:FtsK/SpoIIIE family
MPEFKSRMDSYNWHTPVFGDVFSLDELATQDENLIESNQTRLAVALARSACGVQIVRARAAASYTLYEANIEANFSDEELRDIVYKIEAQEGWILGYNWQTTQRVQFLLRTGNHYPLALPQLISRITFRKASNLASFVIGLSLQQQILVRDWESLGHLLIVGDGGTKQSFIRGILVTMLMLQTPTELRIGFIGTNGDDYHYLQDAPHTLGKTWHRAPEQGIRLLFGMTKEILRRKAIFQNMGVQTLGICNRQLLAAKYAPIPRILLVLDSFGQVEWVKHHAKWMPLLSEIIEQGAEVGIHLIVTARSLHLAHPFDEISLKLTTQLVTRTAAADTHFIEAVEPFHSSLVRFVDGFFIEDSQIIPVELPSVSAYDAKNLVNYWEKNKQERLNLNQLNGIQEPLNLENFFTNGKNLPMPPIPEKPQAIALMKAAEILAEANGNHQVQNSTYIALGEETAKSSLDMKIEMPKPKYVDMKIEMESLKRAQALATYLGWLGTEPLIDVLGLSLEEADVIIAILQARQILERTDNPRPSLQHRQRK